jgi:HemY protein
MKSLFWILVLFALAVGISLVMRDNEAYVQVVLPPYRAEASLNFAVLLAMIGFAALYVLLRILALISSLPRRLRESRARRSHEKATARFSEGVRLYLAGETRKAIDTVSGLRDDDAWSKLAAQLTARAESDLGIVDGQRTLPVEEPKAGLPVVAGAAPDEANEVNETNELNETNEADDANGEPDKSVGTARAIEPG